MISTEPTARTDKAHGVRRRAVELLRSEIAFIPNDQFMAEDAERKILGDNGLAEVIANVSVTAGVPKDLPAHLARLCEAELLTAEVERSLFQTMNYMKFRANALRAKLNREDPDASVVERIELLMEAARAIRDRIARSNMRLVMSIVKKFVTPQLSFDEMLSEGIWSLMQCIDKFDFDRGFRFSTYAYRSIARSSYRRITDLQKEAARYAQTSGENSPFDVEDEGRTSSLEEQTWARLRELLAAMLHNLDRREQFVIRGRYALGAHRKVRTFQSLADKLGVSKERVRQLEQRAVRKLQTMAANVDLDELVVPKAG